MRCQYCGFEESKVVDSRPTEDGSKIRRRRECLSCAKRFTTYEIIETAPLIVVKKDKSREPFNRTKLLRGIARACEKRPVSTEVKEKIVLDIEAKLQNEMVREVSSMTLGEYVMEALKKTDQVAYVRFASVYREFTDVNTFIEEIKSLNK